MPTDPAALQAALQAQLSEVTASEVRVEELRALAGGASQETWRFDLDVLSAAWHGFYPLVVRRQLRGKIHPHALDLAREFRVMQAAYASDVLMPRPYWFLADLLGRPAAVLA